MGCGVTLGRRHVVLLSALLLVSAASVAALAGPAAAATARDAGLDAGPADAGDDPGRTRQSAPSPPSVGLGAPGLGEAADVLRTAVPPRDGCGAGDGPHHSSAPSTRSAPSSCAPGPGTGFTVPEAHSAVVAAGLDRPAPTDPTAPPSHGTRPGTDAVTTSGAGAPTAPLLASVPWATVVKAALAAAAVGLLLLVPVALRARSGRDNELRRRIYERVVDDPGATATRIAEALDIHLTTAIYHLEVLEDRGRIEGIRQGRSTLYFENHRRYGRMEKRVLTALRKDTTSDLLALVADNPGIHCAELARRMDLSRTSVKWHTDRLLDEGLLVDDRRGGMLRLEVPDRAGELMQEYAAAV